MLVVRNSPEQRDTLDKCVEASSHKNRSDYIRDLVAKDARKRKLL